MKSLILAFGLLASGCAVEPQPFPPPVATLSIDGQAMGTGVPLTAYGHPMGLDIQLRRGYVMGTISMASPLGGAIFPYGFSEEEWSLR